MSPAAPAILTFDSMVTSTDVSFQINDDTIFERREGFLIGLSIPSSFAGLVLGMRELTVQIVDNEGEYLVLASSPGSLATPYLTSPSSAWASSLACARDYWATGPP